MPKPRYSQSAQDKDKKKHKTKCNFFWLTVKKKIAFVLQNGYTPLHQAAQQGNTHIINVLLQHGAKPNATTVVRTYLFNMCLLKKTKKNNKYYHFSVTLTLSPVFLLEWKHGSVYCQTSRIHLCCWHTESRHRGGHHNHNGKLLIPISCVYNLPWKSSKPSNLYSCCLVHDCEHQTVTEKHKLNVPETMTEILDVSDEEGRLRLTSPLSYSHQELCIVGNVVLKQWVLKLCVS